MQYKASSFIGITQTCLVIFWAMAFIVTNPALGKATTVNGTMQG